MPNNRNTSTDMTPENIVPDSADHAVTQRPLAGGRRLLMWTIPAALILAGAVLAVAARLRQQVVPAVPVQQLANVETVRVQPAEFIQSLRLPAKIEADRQATVSSELAGELAEWLIAEDSAVEAGQAVARLDTRTIEAQLLALQAGLAAAQAGLDYAEKEFQRIAELAKSDVATEAELDTAANASTQARLAAERIEREIDALQVTRDKAVLRAPIRGHLEEHLAEPGEFVANGQPLARIFYLETVRATVDVPDRYIPFLDRGSSAFSSYISLSHPGAERFIRARLRLPGLPKLTGGGTGAIELPAEIVRIAQAASTDSNTFTVELQLPNPGMSLKQGMLAEAEIDYLRYPQAITIPMQAVQVTDTGPRVLIVQNQNGLDIAGIRDVEPLSIKGDQVLVGSGLEAGDRLIIAGGKGVIHGEPVQVMIEDGVVQIKDHTTRDSAANLTSQTPKP
jgi:membrane fusion protein (multidrug efflux system)